MVGSMSILNTGEHRPCPHTYNKLPNLNYIARQDFMEESLNKSFDKIPQLT